MCGRFAQPESIEEVAKIFDIDQVKMKVKPSYNIAPSQNISVIIYDSNKKSRKLGAMRWGFIPFWAKDAAIGNKMINARSETVAEKNSFKKSFQKKRCLIPAHGFYEWQKKGDRKYPMFIHMKKRKLFAFAGIYNSWKSSGEQLIHSCAIITTEANSKLKSVHNRMPVIIKKENEQGWLDNSSFLESYLDKLMRPCDSSKIEYHRVSAYVNSPKNKSRKCLQAV